MNIFSHAMPANYAKPSVFSRVLNQAGVLLLIALFPALLAGMLHPRKPAWSRERMSLPGVVTAEQIARGEGRTLFVDARNEADYRKQHVPGAIWLNEEHWEEQLLARIFHTPSDDCGQSVQHRDQQGRMKNPG